ncbi:GTP-binding protein [Coemansia sp. RSA 2424]|nr:GTP-binding protein [Coemansia sp. RSA 2424]
MSTNRLDRNVVVLGSAGVGKSSAILRFQRNEYGDDYYPTVTNTYNKRITVNDKEYNLTITDTAGQDETTLLDSTYVGSMDVYVIAFSLVFRRSFEVAQVIRDKILELTGTESAGIVLVGNKSDLYDQREVSTTEAQELAKKFGCPYIETSAKKNINIDELFVKSVRVANKARGGSSDEVEGDTTDKSTCVIM